MYQPINSFAKVGFVMVFFVEGVTYISQPTDSFVRVEFIKVF
jgi:hypothetical protein